MYVNFMLQMVVGEGDRAFVIVSNSKLITSIVSLNVITKEPLLRLNVKFRRHGEVISAMT